MVVRAEGIATQVHRDIREMLLRGEIKPGERLVEVALAAQLGVSRTPIREAVRRLQAEGLVAPLPHGGVAALDARAALQDRYGLRGRVEGFATFLVAERATGEEAKELLEMTRTAAELQPTEAEEQTRLCDLFHRRILELTRFAQLEAFGSMLNMHVLDDLGRDFYHYGPESRQRICLDHVEIAELIIQRECARAEAAMAAHFDSMIAMERDAWDPVQAEGSH